MYKVEKYIGECIDSIVSQKDIDLECVVIDDCGNDKSIEIARERASQACGNVHFKWIRHEKNRGLSAARNSGIAVATGDYVWFVDSDDFIQENVIADIFRKVGNEEPDVICGNMLFFNDGENEFSGRFLKKKENFDELTNEVAETRYFLVPAKIFKRKFLLENSLFFDEGILFEDVNFLLKISAIAGTRVMSVPDGIYFYRQARKNSIMNSGISEKHLESCLFAIEHSLKFANENKFAKFVFEWAVDAFYGNLISPGCPNLSKNIDILLAKKSEWLPRLANSPSRNVQRIYRLLQKPDFLIRFKIYYSNRQRWVKRLFKRS